MSTGKKKFSVNVYTQADSDIDAQCHEERLDQRYCSYKRKSTIDQAETVRGCEIDSVMAVMPRPVDFLPFEAQQAPKDADCRTGVASPSRGRLRFCAEP